MTEEERKAKQRLASKRYRERNREKVLASIADWRSKNRKHISDYMKKKWRSRTPEQIEQYRAKDRARGMERRSTDRNAYNARITKWCRENPDRVLEKNNRWRSRNPDKVRAARVRRRAKPADGRSFTSDDIAEIRRLQRNQCGYCRTKLSRDIEHIDHIVALAVGGTNHRSNIQLLCADCNQRKSKRDPIEFAQSIGYLI